MGFSYILTDEGDIMNDDLEIFFDNVNGYLGSLIKSRQFLIDIPVALSKIDELIELELDLAIIGSKKAMSIAKKETGKLLPIKGGK